MSKYWSSLAREIVPYVPGEQPQDRKYIKINTNENPYPPSPKVLEAIANTAGERLKLYPDPDCKKLKNAISKTCRVNEDCIFVGNGSDEILAFSFMAFFEQGKEILFPDITYSFYEVYAAIFKADYKKIPLSEDFSVPVEDFLASNNGVIIANPNAPTGKCLSLTEIERIVEGNPDVVVIIDEAYIDFGGETAIQLTNKYPNLLVIQTLSKSRSMAGMRVGFAIGNHELIEGLERIKNSFNSYTLDTIAIEAATAAILDEEYFNETCEKVKATRERFSSHLKSLGFYVIPSCANFIFVSHNKIKALDLFAALKQRGILVRYFNKPRIDNFLRISIGTDEEMDRVVVALNEICKY